MDFIEFLGWIFFFYITWQLFKSWFFVQQLKNKIKDAVQEAELVEEIEKRVIALRFEYISHNGNNVVLAYGKNNKFLGQGLTEEEATNNIQLCYPEHKLLIIDDKSNIKKILEPISITNG